MLCAHPLLALGSITYVPNDSQPNDCTWDSLFSDPPPVRPSGVLEGTQFKLGKSMTSRSGDVCSDGSWVFYNTHSVHFIIAIPSSCSFTSHPRLSPLQMPHASTGSLQAKRIWQHHLSFLSNGTLLHREMSTTQCLYSTVIVKSPTSLHHQRFASLILDFPSLMISESGHRLYFQCAA
jgi:hypothetical protein